MVLKGRFKDTLRMVPECCEEALCPFERCFKGISQKQDVFRELHGCLKGFSWLFQVCHYGIPRIF